MIRRGATCIAKIPHGWIGIEWIDSIPAIAVIACVIPVIVRVPRRVCIPRLIVAVTPEWIATEDDQNRRLIAIVVPVTLAPTISRMISERIRIVIRSSRIIIIDHRRGE